MAALRRSGQHGSVVFTWQGATVARAVEGAVSAALEAEVRGDLQGSLHVITGRMARESFADVTVAGRKRTLRLGSTAPYAIYEEQGTSRRAGHHVIRSVADRHVSHVSGRIRAALGGS
jgi:hypothetical protein